MFTGIVQAIGWINRSLPRGAGRRIAVEAGRLPLDEVSQGDSIAVAGCCLTVVAVRGRTLSFDVSAETLRCSTGLETHARVNLEMALRLSDRLGGHLLSGHVDGVGTVARAEPVDAGGGSRLLEVMAPASLARLIAAKAIDAAVFPGLQKGQFIVCRAAHRRGSSRSVP